MVTFNDAGPTMPESHHGAATVASLIISASGKVLDRFHIDHERLHTAAGRALEWIAR